MFRTLTRKVLLMALPVLLTIALSAVLAINGIRSNKDLNDYVSLHMIGLLRANDDFNLQLQEAVAQVDHYRLSRNADDAAESERALRQARTSFATLETLVQQRQVQSANIPADLVAFYPEHRKLQQRRNAIFTSIEWQLKQLDKAFAAKDEARIEQLSQQLQQLHGQSQLLIADANKLADREVAATTAVVEQQNAYAMRAAPLSFLVCAVGVLALLWFLNRRVVQPVNQLAHATRQIAEGNFTPILVTTSDEIGVLQQNLNITAATLSEQRSGLEQHIAALSVARTEAEAAQVEIGAQLATISEQQLLIRDLSVPVLPLSATTLVMPLVGVLDEQRILLVQHQALRALESSQARWLLLDLTGVPLMDATMARGLVQTAQAARLLGSVMLLVGLTPGVTHALVASGADLGSMETFATLQAGVAWALTQEAAGVARL